MNFLLYQNLSPRLVELLSASGHHVEHVRDLGMSQARDEQVLAAAKSREAVLLSTDTDFGELLARSNAAGPSAILLRRQDGRRAA